MSKYFYGDGQDLYIYDWGDYMMEPEGLGNMVGDYLFPIGQQLKPGQGITVDVVTSMVLGLTPEEAEKYDEIFSGYALLHGSNSEVGGFQMHGGIYKDENGVIEYDITYEFHDIMDFEKRYATDVLGEIFFNSMKYLFPDRGYTMKYYNAHIIWNNVITIDPSNAANNSGLFYEYDKSWSVWYREFAYRELVEWQKRNMLIVKSQEIWRRYFDQLDQYIKEHPEYYDLC